MGVDLDDIRELADDFATELRRKNRSQKTIDGYLIRIGYFADFLEDHKLPTSAPDITRDHIGAYIEDLLSRPNKRTGEPLSPEYARGQYRSLHSSSSTWRPRRSSSRTRSTRRARRPTRPRQGR